MKEQAKLELGGAAAGYLYALRAFEEAKNHFYTAYEEAMGESKAANKMRETEPLWKAVGDLIEGQLSEHITNWAVEAQMRTTI